MADTPDGADGAGATSTQRARAARLVRRSRIGMLIGWTLSMAGSEVFAGASPALVVASALPAAWIAGYATLTSIEDVLSPLAVRLLGRARPGRVLLACEGYDVALLVLTLVALALGAPAGAVIAAYMVLASPIPLVLDVVEEIYGAEMAAIDPQTSLRFTSHLQSLSAFFSGVVSIPLGAYLTFVSPSLIVLANLVLSAAAIGARLHGMHAEEEAVRLARTRTEAQETDEPLFASTPAALRHLLGHPLISPASVLARSFATALAGSYVLIHIGQARGQGPYLAVLITVGLGATAGPQVTRLAGQVLSARADGDAAIADAGATAQATSAAGLGVAMAITAAALLTGACLTLAPSAPTTSFWAAAVMLAIAQMASWALATLLIGQRQVTLVGQRFLDATAWSQGAGALGGIAGGWSAIALSTTADPRPALIGAALVYAVLSAYLWWGRRS
ncbi:MFS transporter [Actinomyces bowdenii]|uniref:MFS transporter n=1 Tax=Actinomyces bowdenii TaxID=131109 RepID=UPI001ABCD61F|nr:MFS transporter [Actinomyces bowdenii]MBO3723723.1 MFS transporter [Actinomyces bowdenii]